MSETPAPQTPETKTHFFSDFLSISRAMLSNLECRENATRQFDQLARRGTYKYESWKSLEKWNSVVHMANAALSGIKTQGLSQTATVLEQMLVAEVIIPSKPSTHARALNPKAVSQAILASEQLVACNNERGKHDLAWQLLQTRHKSLQNQMKEIKTKPDTNGLYLKELGPYHKPTRS